MSSLSPGIDPEGLLEYSVVFSDRSLNHMSLQFRQVMREISSSLKRVYAAASVVIVPGGGTFGMEAVARQFATGKKCLVLRNGWFSYRWSQIFEMGSIPREHSVLKARKVGLAFAPAPLDEVLATIKKEKPELVFAPHVETSAGIMLPDSYLKAVAAAVHEGGGLFVLDCIASGAVWVDMKETGVDILLSAPQKGWSATPCAGLVMLSAAASERIKETRSTSFALDLLKWMQIMEAYEKGGHAYHATMPTDGLATFHSTLKEIEAYGFERAKTEQIELGARVRALFARQGLVSVAAEGFEAPGVIVCYTDDLGIHNASKFAEAGLQTAAGVPLMCDEPDGFRTFRIGLFGLDKLQNRERTFAHLETALASVLP